ncbi:(-)-isopiperitenone reductase-like [Prosopis cineraria]|uniref:(-)-isopiperitenone reductase-like n=1 Tax=Prosopis cineraria TaxID=364024 RepID=UPI00240EF600|nr:(-)-isopiperitenone reductase-like [Prosopis cineraria]
MTMKMLASNGVKVVLTARDSSAGIQALRKLKDSGLFNTLVTFHQLDMTNSANIATLFDFVQIHFGWLDILATVLMVKMVALVPKFNDPVLSAQSFDERTRSSPEIEMVLPTITKSGDCSEVLLGMLSQTHLHACREPTYCMHA